MLDIRPHAPYSRTSDTGISQQNRVYLCVCVFAHWNLFVLNKYNRDIQGRYEDSGVVCCKRVSVGTGMSLTAGLGVASSMSAGVCTFAKETGGPKSDGAREDGSVTPGMLGSVEDRTGCMGRGEMPGRFRGGRGGKPTERHERLH